MHPAKKEPNRRVQQLYPYEGGVSFRLGPREKPPFRELSLFADESQRW
jgi:hypothetical protein